MIKTEARYIVFFFIIHLLLRIWFCGRRLNFALGRLTAKIYDIKNALCMPICWACSGAFVRSITYPLAHMLNEHFGRNVVHKMQISNKFNLATASRNQADAITAKRVNKNFQWKNFDVVRPIYEFTHLTCNGFYDVPTKRTDFFLSPSLSLSVSFSRSLKWLLRFASSHWLRSLRWTDFSHSTSIPSSVTSIICLIISLNA